ncbi:MAG: hypothetical protein KGL39_15190 [Patescibacteria group bacterium]|nr:hypothetical protein [Patescibacteria group bacterium]
MLTVQVKGGTNAGRRIVKQPARWICDCGIYRSDYSCATCGARRDR